MRGRQTLAEHVASSSIQYAGFAKRYVGMHGWRSSCVAPCTVLNGSVLAAGGLLPHPWSAAESVTSLLQQLPHLLLRQRDRQPRSPWLKGRVLRIRTPLRDGFWVRPLFVVVQGLWATIIGIRFFVDPHVGGGCQMVDATCNATRLGSSCTPPALCDAYYDPNLGSNAWEQYFDPIDGRPAAQVEASLRPDSIVELDPQIAWLLYLLFDVVYPKSAESAPMLRSLVALLVKHWVRVAPSIALAANEQWKSRVLASAKSQVLAAAKSLVPASADYQPPIVLGVHLRGTDKKIGKIVTPKQYFPLIDSFIAEFEPVCRLVPSTPLCKTVQLCYTLPRGLRDNVGELCWYSSRLTMSGTSRRC